MMPMPQMPMQMPTGQVAGTSPVAQAPTGAVMLPTQYVVRDFFFPQPVQYIQPIEVVNRYHPVPVPQYCVTCTERDIICGPETARE
ncbi:hypothetical protein [Gorillibacterium massiliense]|uniref:hypothetical protein n=1 Tax=Gorillibacterium massiliense TaxID=1280390 RepID=UPI0004B76084|nr:hypothetical protein [Gorillibacterium massiliense]